MESTSNAASKRTGRPSPRLQVASGPRPLLLVGSSIFPRWVPGPHHPFSGSENKTDISRWF